MTQLQPQTVFPTLARRTFPQSGLLTDALLVLGGAALVALLAQAEIPLKPVPITLQTLGVLLVGAALGWKRGGLALLLYVLAGSLGLHVFAGGKSGFGGASSGYLVGFVVAAGLVGWLVQRFGLDRRVLGTALAMLAGNVVIYLFGLPWLAQVIGVPWLSPETGLDGKTVLGYGLIPFLLGDTLKLVLAALLLPTAWKLLKR
jgi:biotin transport system substrate-specific component